MFGTFSTKIGIIQTTYAIFIWLKKLPVKHNNIREKYQRRNKKIMLCKKRLKKIYFEQY